MSILSDRQKEELYVLPSATGLRASAACLGRERVHIPCLLQPQVHSRVSTRQ